MLLVHELWALKFSPEYGIDLLFLSLQGMLVTLCYNESQPHSTTNAYSHNFNPISLQDIHKNFTV